MFINSDPVMTLTYFTQGHHRFRSQFRTFEVVQKFQYLGVGHEIGL